MLSITLFSIPVLSIVAILFALQMSSDQNDDGLRRSFEKKHLPITIAYKNGIRYQITGNPEATHAIFFVHGAPGALGMFNKVIQDSILQQKAFIISADRIGYGKSFPGEAQTAIDKQAEALVPIVKEYPNKKWIIYGHSFGAPIAAYMAYLLPKEVCGLVLAGGAVDPKLEKYKWLAKMCLSIPFKWIFSSSVKVASLEKISHQQSLIGISYIWKDLQMPVCIQHGTNDWVVPYKNIEYLKKQLVKAPITIDSIKGENHFFFSKIDKIRPVLLNFLK